MQSVSPCSHIWALSEWCSEEWDVLFISPFPLFDFRTLPSMNFSGRRSIKNIIFFFQQLFNDFGSGTGTSKQNKTQKKQAVSAGAALQQPCITKEETQLQTESHRSATSPVGPSAKQGSLSSHWGWLKKKNPPKLHLRHVWFSSSNSHRWARVWHSAVKHIENTKTETRGAS